MELIFRYVLYGFLTIGVVAMVVLIILAVVEWLDEAEGRARQVARTILWIILGVAVCASVGYFLEFFTGYLNDGGPGWVERDVLIND